MSPEVRQRAVGIGEEEIARGRGMSRMEAIAACWHGTAGTVFPKR
jgi:hypothetical protein